MKYTVTNFTGKTITTQAEDGWVVLTVGDTKISLNEDELSTLVTILGAAAEDAANQTLDILQDIE